jgi:hypothetical protein
MHNSDWNELIQRYLAGQTTDEETSRLEAAMKADDALADLYLRHAELDVALEIEAEAVELTRELLSVHGAPSTRHRFPWLSWRPLTAAAAGLVMGLFSASMVFAYVAPSLGKATSLLQDGFESGPAPLVTGVPIEVGVWSGDCSTVVGEHEGVKPSKGMKMLRFLRGDYEGKSIPSSHSSDVFRLVDLRPHRHEFADGGAVVQLTADFNTAPFASDESFSATLTIFALDASLVGNEMVKLKNVLSTESLAFSRSSKVTMDRNPATWQKMSNELRLPPSTEFLMVRLGMSNNTKLKDKRRDRFAGHFADNVQLVIARRPEIPVP